MMKPSNEFIIFIFLLLVSGDVFSSQNILVDEMYRISKNKVLTESGKEFDSEIQRITVSDNKFESGLRLCMSTYELSNLYGVYVFVDKNQAYKVYLKPQSDFSGCVSKLLEGHELPFPPTYPYYSPFEFKIR